MIRHSLLIVGPKPPNVRVVFGDNLTLTNHVRTLLLPRANLAGTRIPTMFGDVEKVAVSNAFVIRLAASLSTVHISFKEPSAHRSSFKLQ